MSLIEIIKKEMYKSMKAGETEKTTTFRTLLAKLKDKKIEKGVELSKQDELSVLKQSAKQRRESIAIFKKSNRDKLLGIEKRELAIIESFLPKMLNFEETKDLVKSVIKNTGAHQIRDISIVMPQVMKKSKGQVDGKIANQIAKGLLE